MAPEMAPDQPPDTPTSPPPTNAPRNPDCLFCKIVAGELPAEVVATTDRVLAFRDVNPQAPLHVLVIPRSHHADVASLAHADGDTLAELVTVGARIAADEQDGEFRLVFNTGPQAGQTVFHTHGHVLAGRSMAWPPG
ncbi:MAG: histidine triad nucleotide-binding protein [Actinomycetes bacterium]